MKLYDFIKGQTAQLMNEIDEARKLLWQATVLRQKAVKLLRKVALEERRKERRVKLNAICVCGHRRSEHSDSYSINFTGGCCIRCECMNFVLR